MTRATAAALALLLGLSCVSRAGFAQEGGPAGKPAPDPVQINIEKARERLGDRLLTTADEVVARHVEAIGGAEALRRVQTLTMRGRTLSASPAEIPIIRYYRAPNLIRQQAPDADWYYACDGAKVFKVGPDGRSEVDQPWARGLVRERIDNGFLDYRERGITYEYIGVQSFDTEASVLYHLRRTLPDGHVEELYFDVDEGLLRLIDDHHPRHPSLTALYEYREVGGVRFSHLRVQRAFAKLAPPHVFVVDEIKVNEPLPEDFFR
jgi:hypothetical protein